MSCSLAGRVDRLLELVGEGSPGHGPIHLLSALLAALHGVEASLLASDSLRRLRSSVYRVVWSRRQPLASVGAELRLMDGPTVLERVVRLILLYQCI